MEESLLLLRRATYALFVELGRAPTIDEATAAVGRTPDEVLDGWRVLHEQHALVLDDARSAIRMANPFSAVPTAFRVQADGRSWFANCAWDAFGVCAALGVDGRIETACADCREPISISVQDKRPSDRELLFHCLVPASKWWDNIVFT
jgi:hypothetical protein